MKYTKEQVIWGLLRLSLGWIFFWAFIDKLFGLGFATVPAKSWLAGGSPTLGFLKFGTKGPFVDFFQSIAGNPLADWLFMLGLLFVGLTLLFGIAVRLGSFSGILMMALIYIASAILPVNNPFMDEHLIYILVLASFMAGNAGDYLGFGRKWSETSIVRKFNILK